MSSAHPSPHPPGAPRSGALGARIVLLAVLFLPIAELAVAIQVGRRIGVAWTLLLLLAGFVAGGWVIRRQGLAAWRSYAEAARGGRAPARTPADAALVLLAGMLLAFPGFITDVLAVVLLVPFTRRATGRVLGTWLSRAVLRRVSVATIRADVVQGEVVTSEVVDGPGGDAAGLGGAGVDAGTGADGPVIRGEIVGGPDGGPAPEPPAAEDRPRG